MDIFLTGATGYLGGAIARELTAAGHKVTGLARSAASARKLQAARVVPHSGSLADAGSLAAGARSADAVIHTALDAVAKAPHETDIEAAGSFLRALAGTGKAFVYTSGLTVLGDTGGIMADEDTPPNPIRFSAWRPALEKTVLAAAGHQVRSIVIRPGWVYGRGGGIVRLLCRRSQAGRCRQARRQRPKPLARRAHRRPRPPVCAGRRAGSGRHIAARCRDTSCPGR
jgi:nucleoside-diphosphate-sugar epimerase